MKHGLALAVLGLMLFAATSPARSADIPDTPDPAETLFQVSTLDALLAGGYDGSLSLAELARHGDLGLGTFQSLDGEMIVLDGVVYQARVDGTVVRPAGDMTTPFAAVTDFAPDLTLDLGPVAGFQDLADRLAAALPSANHVYAVRATLARAEVKTRSVAAQEPPFRPLAEVVKVDQRVRQWPDATGELVGFWCPAWLGKLNAPGLHLHFLNAERTGGGHLLDIQAQSLVLELDTTPALTVLLPEGEDFARADLDRDRSGQTKAVEHQTSKQ